VSSFTGTHQLYVGNDTVPTQCVVIERAVCKDLIVDRSVDKLAVIYIPELVAAACRERSVMTVTNGRPGIYNRPTTYSDQLAARLARGAS